MELFISLSFCILIRLKRQVLMSQRSTWLWAIRTDMSADARSVLAVVDGFRALLGLALFPLFPKTPQQPQVTPRPPKKTKPVSPPSLRASESASAGHAKRLQFDRILPWGVLYPIPRSKLLFLYFVKSYNKSYNKSYTSLVRL